MSSLFLPSADWIQAFFFFAVLFLLVKPTGLYIAHVLEGEHTFMTPFIRPVEKAFYALCRIDTGAEMRIARYVQSFFIFAFVGFLGLLTILLIQDFPDVEPSLAFNASISFLTGTNWQAYIPETSFTEATQRIGFTVQNFLAAASGIAVMAVIARSLKHNEPTERLGHFWMDMTRIILYILLPMALILALALISQGVVQSFTNSIFFSTLEGKESQILSLGPVASQIAIKQLGTNGGGFFTANAGHPFENPTAFSNFLEVLALLLLPAALTVTFGKMVGAPKQGWLLFFAMTLLFIPALAITYQIEASGNPFLDTPAIDQSAGNMEGKELRFGQMGTALMTTAATATSGGSLNGSMDSSMPLSALPALFLMMIGEVVYGGLGTGLCGMIVYILFTVFLTSLMIGRSPEYLGKKIGVQEMKMVAIILIVPAVLSLGGTAMAVLLDAGRNAATNPGAQGFSQILYSFASSATTNGSAMAGLSADTDFYNIALGFCMLIGRFATIAALFGLSASFAGQSASNSREMALRTDTPMFLILLIFIIFVGALTYVPALTLGPLAEHVALIGGVQ
jgi:K+-transporting ATPase ATPase A chain